ncbi:SAM and SH3 domain-containing protein 1-like isoform X2 [Vespula squamosa]|uniref:SAM and SH3 domain-containing protein 1-like isoform X2 n=1 Tax=Vespula squamosa TaxID=30214 RepID=A0ABD1ZW93_VESSQ
MRQKRKGRGRLTGPPELSVNGQRCCGEPRFIRLFARLVVVLAGAPILPPSSLFTEQGQNTSKKKTTFSRLLRGLKTHKKEKQGQTQGSPRHGRARIGVPQRVDTPDSVLQSGLGPGPDMGHTILRSMVDPRDYDRLRYLQMNGGQPNSFEETINRLKVQEALRQKERFHKEHEEILRDIRHGLMQLGRDGRGQVTGDDTYMYDEDARCGGTGGLGGGLGGQHWYDEPPYESDPDDFLMGASGGPVPTATIQNGRVCFTLNPRPENRGEGVISLRTAGDISLPRERSKGAASTMRGLIVPQGHNNPPTIIPLTHSRASRESGDYASSDVQSEASALLDEETKTGVGGRARNLRHDVQTKISRLRQDRASSEAFPCSASSVESLPSGSGSSTQALVRAGSNHSSISCEERDAISPTSIGPVLCRARALVDYTPSPYDKDALKFKKGDIIDVVQMNKSGLWKGVVHNRIGHFKFINVEILNDRVPRRGDSERSSKWGQRYRQKPGSVQELLQRMNLQEHISVFVLNGYEDLELFREIEPADLDYLSIHQPEHRAKILTAVQLLHDLHEGDLASSSEGDEVSRLVLHSGQTSGHCSPFNRRQFPRDSGCYDAHKNPTSRRNVSPESSLATKISRENNLDGSAQSKIAAGNVTGEGNTLTDVKDDFHPNIPIGGSLLTQKEGQFDKSPLLRGGSARAIGKRSNFGETVVIEEACEGNQKLGMVKYVVGGNTDLGLEAARDVATALSQRGCLSEKSSDSGVSSSSISSAPPPRDKSLATGTGPSQTSVSPTKNQFGNFTRTTATIQTTAKTQGNASSEYP